MAESWKVKNRRWHANLGMMAAVTLGLIALSCPFIAHKWDGGVGKALKRIHYGEFLPNHLKWIWIDSQGFLLAFLVVSGWLMHKKAVKTATRNAAEDPKAAGSSVTVLDLDGTGKGLALVTKAQAKGLRAFHCPAAQFPELQLMQEKWLLVTGTGEALSEEAKTAIRTHLTSVQSGSLKRLEFSLEPPASQRVHEGLASALQEAGARPMKISATTAAAWSAQVLALLGGRSAPAAPRPQKAADDNTPSPGAALPEGT